MTQQFILGFWFYFIFSLFAGIGFLLSVKTSPKNKELAYFVSKPLGLAVFGYVIWLLGSLKILNFQDTAVIAVLFVILVVYGIYYAFLHLWKPMSKFERKKCSKNLLWLEVLSLFLYAGYLYIRAFNSSAYGTERFMDMALVNASLKTDFFPFLDPWYSSKVVNYYYYGHYLVSVITKLSFLSSFLTYNFAIGILYSLST